MTGRYLYFLGLALVLLACSDPASGGNGSSDVLGPDRGDRLNDVGTTDQGRDDPATGDLADTDGDDVGSNDGTIDDSGDDGGDNPHLICQDDADNDGYIASACGGRDCNDEEIAMNPGLPEACDFLDNNCDTLLNNGITCTFYATTDDALYLVDPFKGETERLADAPELWDIDTHPEGTLFGVTEEALYLFTEATNSWVRVGDLDHSGGEANGLAIDLDGIAYLTAGNDLYTLDLRDATTSWVGAMGGDFESSGDCVVNKNNILYMSSEHLDGTDSLVIIDGLSGNATQVGAIGHDRIYGLTAAWGYLFGLTSSGELIAIDEATGEGELLTTFPGQRWFGAASSPTR